MQPFRLHGALHLKNLKAFLYRPSLYPVYLFLFGILAHGLLIPFLGFYWDDWPMIWFSHTQGAGGFIGAFSGDRPFLSLVYVLTTPIFGSSPLGWQILALVVRVSLGISAWWLVRLLWPQRYQAACWVGLLMVVYPGFKQQPISVVYGNGLILLISYLASHALMILAMQRTEKRPKLLLFAASILTYAFCLLSTEYYIGLDFLRLVMIWVIIRRDIPRLKNAWKKILLTWLPYLSLLIGFLIWRVFVFEFPTYQPVLLETVENGSIGQFAELIFRIFNDPLIASWRAWQEAFRFPELTELTSASSAAYWILFPAAGVLAWLVLRLFKTGEAVEENAGRLYLNEIFLLSGAALITAGFPFWVTSLPIRLSYPYDRFLLAYMPGASLLIVALLEWLIKKNYQKNILLALLIGASIAANFQNANTYRREWITLQNFMQQLAWRAPSIDERTILLTSTSPFTYYSDNSLTAPLNLLYDADNTSLNLNYYLAFTDVRLGRSIPSLEKDQPIYQRYRNALFEGNTSNALVFFYSPPGCLRILDPIRDASSFILPESYKDTIALSNLDLIQPEANNTLTEHPEWFGGPAENTWCYYFEHADLEYQFGNWESVVSWFEQAQGLGLAPEEPSEWLIYMEGLFMTGAVEDASEFAGEFFFDYPSLNNQVCEMMTRVAASDPALSGQAKVEELLKITDCEGKR